MFTLSIIAPFFIIFFGGGIVVGIQYPFSERRNHVFYGRRSVEFIRHAHGRRKFQHRVFRISRVLFLRGYRVTDVIEIQPFYQRILFDEFFIIGNQEISRSSVGRIDEYVCPAFFALINRSVVVVYNPVLVFAKQSDVGAEPYVEIFHPGMHFDAAFCRQSGECGYIIFIRTVRSGNKIFMIFHVIGTEHGIAVEKRFQQNEIDARIAISIQRFRQRFQRFFGGTMPHGARRNGFAFGG